MNNIVVTGANRGIGLELVRSHLSRGDLVIAGCRRPDQAEALAELGVRSILPVDVSDEASVAAFADRVTDALEGETLDVLYNNAGASGAAVGVERGQGGVMTVPMEAVEGLIRINGLSAATVSRSLRPLMTEGSKIVNVSSQIGSMVVGKAFADLPYSTSKAVMNMVTVQLAQALQGEGIVVTAFHPGWVRTDMGGSSADLAPEDAAAGIVEITAGHTLGDTGGFYRHDGSVHPW